MNINRMTWIISAVLTVAASANDTDFDLPLELRPNNGKDGMKCISNGVPLATGAVMDTSELHVLAPDGQEVPSQYRVLARWWKMDNSIRWVLVDFVRSDSEPANPIYRLVRRKSSTSRPKTDLVLEQDDDFIRVDTGPALFEANRRHFNLLNRVVIDGNTFVHPNELMGSVTEDPEGRKYYSSRGTRDVRIIDEGPVRATLMAKGVHRSMDEDASERILYGFEIFMTFHAGQSSCDIDAILTNNFPEPCGEPHFEDWSVLVKIGDGTGAGGTFAPLRGHEAMSVKTGESALLYQDSLGADNWKEFTGLQFVGGRQAVRPNLATFRGYKIWSVSAEEDTEVGAGDFSDGRIACSNGEVKCEITPRHFWQQFPSAIELGGDGVLRFGVLPREYSSVHWLEDASAKGQEFRLTFGSSHAGNEGYLSRTVALPPVEYCAKVGALGEFEAYMQNDYILEQDIDMFSHGGKPAKEKRSIAAARKGSNAFGWQIFGHEPHEVGGHTPWNYEPLATSGKLFRFILTGHPGWYEWGMPCARSARDVRAYLIDDQDNLGTWKTWNDYVKRCVREEWPRRLPNDGLHPYRRHGWVLPNMEHHNLDEVYDLYLFTGDDRARRCLDTIAAHAAISSTLKYRPRRPRRLVGWTIRTLARYYELTGDKRFQPYLREGIDQIWEDVNKAGPADKKGGNWYLGIYARGAINAYRAIGDERMRDLALGCADWAMTYEVNPEHGYGYQQFPDPWNHKPEDRGKVLPEEFKKYWFGEWYNGYMLAMFAFAYHETGDPKYADAFDFAFEKNNRNAWLGLFPGELYMRHHSRSDSVAPAAVTDLNGKTVKGQVTLGWTAPGNDGDKGTAAVYHIKYSTKPILEFVPWPEKMSTHITFWGSENIIDEPAPEPAGTHQSYVFDDVKPGKYFFALTSRDECSNQSPISNVVTVDVK